MSPPLDDAAPGPDDPPNRRGKVWDAQSLTRGRRPKAGRFHECIGQRCHTSHEDTDVSAPADAQDGARGLVKDADGQAAPTDQFSTLGTVVDGGVTPIGLLSTAHHLAAALRAGLMGPRRFDLHGAEWAPRLKVDGSQGTQRLLGVVA